MSLPDESSALSVTVSWLLLAPAGPPTSMKLTERHSEFEPVTSMLLLLAPEELPRMALVPLYSFPPADTVAWLPELLAALPMLKVVALLHREPEPVTRTVFPLPPTPTWPLVELTTWPPLLTVMELVDPAKPT